MRQKEFSEKKGIAQSSISDWKRKKTNSVSEKILIICSVLDVTPYELQGGTDGIGSRSNPSEYIMVTKDSEYGRALMQFLELEKGMQGRLLGNLQALLELQREEVMIMSIEGTGWSPAISIYTERVDDLEYTDT